jgi:hypothetical protein
MSHISIYKELRVYQAAMKAAMRIFELSKHFPIEERYSLTDQIRRLSFSLFQHRRGLEKAPIPRLLRE